MSYDDFPDEFAILKGSLENEDFDRAESVLLMILKKKSDFQQAKLDLEKVKGKLGSISNYEFRVRAFIDQGEIETAKKVLKEAVTKFRKNRKIRALADKMQDQLGKIADEAAQARSPELVIPDNELPNLETFVADGAATEMLRKAQDAMKQIKDTGVTGGGSAAAASSTAPLNAPLGGGTRSRMGLPTQPLPSGGAATEAPGMAAPISADSLRARRQEEEGTNKLNAILAGGLGAILVVVFIVLLVVFAGLESKSIKPPAAVDGSLPADTTAFLDRWDKGELTIGQKELLINGFLDADVTTFQGRLNETETVYARLVKHAETDDAVKQRIDRLQSWRVNVRRMHNERTPVDPAGLSGPTWNPSASPPQYGTAPVRAQTLSVVGMAVAVALIPGLILGMVLAWCHMPVVNRLFDSVWAFWYAFPAVGMLYLGMARFGDLFSIKHSATLGAILIGFAMIPHIAFYSRPGFANIINKSPAKTAGLSAVVALSAALAGFARFLGEGVIVLGVVGAASGAEYMQPVQTFGREMIVALQQVVGLSAAVETEVRYAVAMHMGFWLLLTTFGLATLSQLLLVAASHEGLKEANRPTPEEWPDHPRQAAFGTRNLILFGTGLFFCTIVGVLFLAAHSSAGNVVQAGAGWGDWRPEDAARIASGTMGFAAVAGAIAIIGAVFVAALPSLLISGRFARSVAESFLRIPTVIPPVVFVLLGVATMRSASGSSDAWTATFVAAMVLLPVGGVLLMQAWETYRRGPYVPNSRGQKPNMGMLIGAGALDVLATACTLIALAAGSYVFVFALGADLSEAKFPALSTYLVHALHYRGVGAEPAHQFYSQIVWQIGTLIAIGLILRVVAEILARTANAQRR